jgi:hypothetical protein
MLTDFAQGISLGNLAETRPVVLSDADPQCFQKGCGPKIDLGTKNVVLIEPVSKLMPENIAH